GPVRPPRVPTTTPIRGRAMRPVYGRAESGLPCHAVRGVWGLIALALLAAAMSVPANGQHGARCVTRDTPDLKFVDSNCDGIDGDAKNAVFVAPDGNDAAPGTMKRP